ncbi:acyltransferase family protein [Mesorhizobium sp. B1-1-7]|uniref:acyltransferase family protein n=1 Tax=Mesorhizobium sp. B1-1-7 TaxID=2589977 RepID=UPI001126D020|nr:acyltransferase family protein [Mesorhizobium sp. B1-1-7]TPN53279.1 acyltransferase [Mesorhizobium sp. B1-1-7]
MDRKPHYFTLDFLRIVSAILVLLSHFATYAATSASVTSGEDAAFGFLSVFAGLGAAGVATLFVISGFAIAMSASRDGGVSAALRFARIRATRILPALWLSAIVSLGARAFYGEDFRVLVLDAIRSAVLSPKGPYIDGVVWSLVVQVTFYLLVAVCVISKFRLSLYDLAKLIGLSSSAYLLVMSGLHLAPSSAGAEGAIAVLSRFPFKLLLLQHGVFFAAGMLFFVASNQDRGPRPSYMPMTILFVAFSIMGIIEILLNLDNSGEYRYIAVSIYVFLLSAMALGNFFDLKMSKTSGMYRGAVKYIGRISYTVYLNHYALGMVIVWFLFRRGLSASAVFVVSVASVLIVSAGVSWLEKKIQNAITGRFARPISGAAKLAAM